MDEIERSYLGEHTPPSLTQGSGAELITWLENNVSREPIMLGETLEEAHRRAGAWDLVCILKGLLHDQAKSSE